VIYSCTRLLIGLNGLEGSAIAIANWLQTDWLSNKSNWDSFRPLISESATELGGRTLIVMNSQGGIAGLTTLGMLVESNPGVE
jgi:hypothetical protein